MSDSGIGEGHHHHQRKPWSQWSGGAKAGLVIGLAIGIPALLALCGGVTMWLWNALMPGIFKLPEIGFWQAIGLLLLSQIFFKGGHIGRAGKGQWKKRQVWKHMQDADAPEPNAGR